MKPTKKFIALAAALAVAAIFHPLIAGAAALKASGTKLAGFLIGALGADRNTSAKKASQVAYKVAAAKKIYAGALVAFNATGYLTPGATATTLTYVGRAAEFADNTGGADGDITCLVDRPLEEAFYYANSGGDPVDQTCLGKTCWIVDDQTVSKSNAGGNTQSAAGIVVDLDANGVWVK